MQTAASPSEPKVGCRPGSVSESPPHTITIICNADCDRLTELTEGTLQYRLMAQMCANKQRPEM
jgi:hypothetical protein